MNNEKNSLDYNDNIKSINIHNLGKKFRFLWALKGVTLTFNQKSIIGLVGPNGAGKSTLLNLLATIIRPTVGTITIFNHNIKEKTEELRKNIVLFSYHSFLYDELTGWENLLFWSKLYDLQKGIEKTNLREYIALKAENFGIINWLERPVRELSTGMRKKVDFLRISLIKPNLILLDEPFSGMDPKNISSFLDELENLRKACTIVIASHNLELITEICDNIHILKKGKIFKSILKGGISSTDLKVILTDSEG